MTCSIDIYLMDENDDMLASTTIRSTRRSRATNDLAHCLDLLNSACDLGATVAKIYVNDEGGSPVSSYKLRRRETGHFRFVESLEYEIQGDEEEGE